MQSLNHSDTIHPQNLSNLPLVDGSNFVELSARLQPMRRLKTGHVLRLCNEDVFTIVISWTDKKDNAVVTDPRAHVTRGMKRIIGEWAVGDASKKREYIDKQMQKHAVTRGGGSDYLFNVRLKSFPERLLLQTTPLPLSEISNLLEINRPGGKGMYLELMGYGVSKRLLLRLKDFPYVQVFKQREKG